jgi:hypothetical protein
MKRRGDPKSRTTHARVLVACVLGLTPACRSASGEDDAASAEETSDGGATTGAKDDPFDALVQCDETDFVGSPFMGPAFDPETGEPLAPLQPPYVVAATLGWPKPEPAAYEALGNHSEQSINDVLTREGLLGVSVGTSEACGSARTLSLWADEASLRAFVMGKVHRAAIGVVPTAMQAWATTHWTETSATTPPTFAQAQAKLIEER